MYTCGAAIASSITTCNWDIARPNHSPVARKVIVRVDWVVHVTIWTCTEHPLVSDELCSPKAPRQLQRKAPSGAATEGQW